MNLQKCLQYWKFTTSVLTLSSRNTRLRMLSAASTTWNWKILSKCSHKHHWNQHVKKANSVQLKYINPVYNTTMCVTPRTQSRPSQNISAITTGILWEKMECSINTVKKTIFLCYDGSTLSINRESHKWRSKGSHWKRRNALVSKECSIL